MYSVLIVENNSFFRKSFSETLRMYIPNLFIDEASTGREAVQRLNAHLPNMVFMDIHLAGKNSLLLTKEIKTQHPEIAVCIFTNYDIPEYRNIAHQYGADHFFLKDAVSGAQIAELIQSSPPVDSSLLWGTPKEMSVVLRE